MSVTRALDWGHVQAGLETSRLARIGCWLDRCCAHTNGELGQTPLLFCNITFARNSHCH